MHNVNIVNFADVHLGHPRISPHKTVYDARAYLFPALMDCQLCLLGGDFFHSLLNIDHEGTHCAVHLILDLLRLAKQQDFYIRILQGTYSHDRDQCRLFTSLAEVKADHEQRLQYIDTLSVEYLERFDAKLLYLPDNLPYRTSDDCMVVVREKLAALQWDKVDLVLGHGYFEHVLPPAASRHQPFAFREEQFRHLVDGYVLMGHVHTHSKYKKIIYTSSFDRTAHGEEEPKGFLKIRHQDGQWTCQFVINHDATPFLTISPKGDTRDEQLHSVREELRHKYPRPALGYLRIMHNDLAVRQELASALAVHYPNLQITHVAKDVAETTQTYVPELEFLIEEDQVIPTEQNLPELTYRHIQDRNPASTLTVARIEELLRAA